MIVKIARYVLIHFSSYRRNTAVPLWTYYVKNKMAWFLPWSLKEFKKIPAKTNWVKIWTPRSWYDCNKSSTKFITAGDDSPSLTKVIDFLLVQTSFVFLFRFFFHFLFFSFVNCLGKQRFLHGNVLPKAITDKKLQLWLVKFIIIGRLVWRTQKCNETFAYFKLREHSFSIAYFSRHKRCLELRKCYAFYLC